MRLVALLRKVRYLRYVAVSAIALGIDMVVFLTMIALGVHETLAATAGYLLGVVAHWVLSSRKVFQDETAESSHARNRQKALFLTSAFVGLGLTVGIVSLIAAMGYDPRLAKLVAIAVSFNITYMLRRRVVFT